MTCPGQRKPAVQESSFTCRDIAHHPPACILTPALWSSSLPVPRAGLVGFWRRGKRPSSFLRGVVMWQLLSGCRDLRMPGRGVKVGGGGGWVGLPGEEGLVGPQEKAELTVGRRGCVSKVKMVEVAAEWSRGGPRRKLAKRLLGVRPALLGFTLHIFPRPSQGQQCPRH